MTKPEDRRVHYEAPSSVIRETAVFAPAYGGYPEEKFDWIGPGTIAEEGNPGSGFFAWTTTGISKRFERHITPGAKVQVGVEIRSIAASERVRVTHAGGTVEWPITQGFYFYYLPYCVADSEGVVNLAISLVSGGWFKIRVVEVHGPIP